MAARKMMLYALLFVIGLLLANDIANYWTTKRELHRTLETQMREMSAQIKISVDRSQQAYRYVDTLMASNLRSAAIAAKYALPASYRQVDNERLKRLAEELNISYVTLFARTPDDVVTVRSSDPREIGLSTKTWDNYHDAFLQLFDHRNVEGLDYGQSMTNYWAGEIAPSSSILSDKKNKFGYFYDGTTDYLINPIMNTKYIEELERYAGVETILKDTMEQHERVLEITLFNPLTFSVPDEELVNVRHGVEMAQYDTRKVLFGAYELRSPNDAAHIDAAHRQSQVLHRFERIDGRSVYRTYFPVAASTDGQPYVIGITTDYAFVQSKLNEQLKNLGLVTSLAFVASLAMIALLYRYVKRTRDEVAQTVQDNYNEEVESLFVAVRGERHDFVNHLNTLKAMADTKRYEQLHRYIKELVDETIAMNDIVSIGHPAVAAIIQSKSAVALRQRIDFSYRFEGMKGIESIHGVKSVDLVKILANLIDNAFEEVMELAPEERRVCVNGWMEREEIVFSVSNTLRDELSNEELLRMFQPTYTTKKRDGHSGLGLSIVREKARQYRGKVTVGTPAPRTIEFVVSVPIGG
ncbi:GHKL domain-containing protein [Paenibacillus antri]|uniref:GHKL domain-containing protein n=1 Tax=Paenibacillus antri TaxID=2582848 RepID=A0A5R9GC51_9BACL|nr:GHKL domain-containing protein [Paenibacillus antri]TLS50968.1 GHKL domain-containing protein [Paenibacillus antri]